MFSRRSTIVKASLSRPLAQDGGYRSAPGAGLQGRQVPVCAAEGPGGRRGDRRRPRCRAGMGREPHAVATG